MSTVTEKILKKALQLPAVERATLADGLLASLDQPDEAIDKAWRKEVGSRLKAYRSGRIPTVSLGEVLAKYRKS